MNLNPQQKLEDILKKAKMFGELTTSDLLYPSFPDNDDLKSTRIGNFRKVIEKLLPENDTTEYILRLNECIYTVTEPDSETQKVEYNNCRLAYNAIIDEIFQSI